MKKETKLKKQYFTAKGWARKARLTLEPQSLSNIGLLYLQVAVEQTLKYINLEKGYEATSAEEEDES